MWVFSVDHNTLHITRQLFFFTVLSEMIQVILEIDGLHILGVLSEWFLDLKIATVR